MAGKYLRGALVEFMPTFLIPLPNVILFQFNPETMTHTWTSAQSQGLQSNPLAVKGAPGELFSFSLAMDAGDTIADNHPVTSQLAQVSGVYSRLAALEMLLYPVATAPGAGSLLASVSVGAGGISVGGAAGGTKPKTQVPQMQLPTVLFVWGPGRIVPVRVTSLTITERLYDAALNPIHADAQIGLSVLTAEELANVTGPLAVLAKGASVYSQGLRQALALANLANATDLIIGMLPLG